jgi:hypothetical protein
MYRNNRMIFQIIIIIVFCGSIFGQPPSLDELQPGEWTVIPFSLCRYEAADITGITTLERRNGNFRGIMSAWSGGAFDTKRGRLIIWGGGHNSYAGNELYVFDVNTLKWSRLNEPNENPNRCNDKNSDGTPVARHTYNQIEYLEYGDRFFGLGGACDCQGGGGCPGASTWLFDFETLKWSSHSAGSIDAGYGENCAYDPVSKKVYFHSNGVFSFDFDNKSWTKHNSEGGGYYHTSTIDTKRRKMVVVGHGDAFSFDLTSPNLTKENLPSGGVSDAGNPGLAYDPVADKVVGWKGGAEVYLLDMDTKQWSTKSPAATNRITPTDPNGNGTYGRFRYVPSRNAFILVNSVDEMVFFYRLTPGAGIQEDGSASNLANGMHMNILPNPFNANVNIRMQFKVQSSKLKVQIYNCRGELVKDLSAYIDAPFSHLVWNAENLSSGIYLLKVTLKNRTYTRKLILQ